MRIDRLEIENFKRFVKQTFELHPQFTLFVGENGAGKTSVVDALAVAASIWLVEGPDSTLYGRNILTSEIRLEREVKGDRTQFRERRPVIIRATGQIGDHPNVSWTRQIRPHGKRTTNAEAKDALAEIRSIYDRDKAGRTCSALCSRITARAELGCLPRHEFQKQKPTVCAPMGGFL